MKLKKRRRGRVGMVVLIVILVLLGVLAWWQRDNIKAVVTFATTSQADLEQQIQQNEQAIKDAVEANPAITVREITEEEREALRNGTLTMEELLERLKRPFEPLTPAQPEQPAQSEKPAQPETPAEPEQPAQPQPQQPETPATPEQPVTPTEPEQPAGETEYQKKLNDILARVYVLREEFVLKLDELQKQAVADFKKIESGASGIKDFIFAYFGKATALEAECDAKMDAIITDLVALQKEYGEDMELVNTVAYTYANEKSLKKAWYMNELQRRGLI